MTSVVRGGEAVTSRPWYTLTRTVSATTVTATGTFPAGYEGWLSPESETDAAKTCVLYFEPPDAPGAGDPETFSVRERYRPTDQRTVFVRDSTGVQRLP